MNADFTPSEAAKLLRIRPIDAHKGTMGHAFLMAGSYGIAGCAILAAEACLRSGVGKLTIWAEESNRVILQSAVPEAILNLQESVHTEIYQALGIGPGIGLSASNRMEMLLRESTCPLVLDADALHILANKSALFSHLAGRCILTPHLGEMKHLSEGTGLSAPEMAKKYQVVVVLKGHPTHIYLPNGHAITCPRGNAGMATPGSGDVLTGLTTGLLAQGYQIEEAAALGVWLHASAGDAAADALTQECMLARDIIHYLPDAFRELHEIKQN